MVSFDQSTGDNPDHALMPAFGRKYDSLVGRCGKKKALVAVGHKIIIAAYHVIKDKVPYKEPELHNNSRRKRKQIKNYLNRLKEIGFDISLIQNELEGRFFTEQIESSSMKLT